MFDVIHSYKSDHMFFGAVDPEGDHAVYLSAYGRLASVLLEKYMGNQREDNEEVFSEWDKSVQKAASQIGFSATHECENGHIYINSYQNGIGMPEEDEDGTQKSGK